MAGRFRGVQSIDLDVKHQETKRTTLAPLICQVMLLRDVVNQLDCPKNEIILPNYRNAKGWGVITDRMSAFATKTRLSYTSKMDIVHIAKFAEVFANMSETADTRNSKHSRSRNIVTPFTVSPILNPTYNSAFDIREK